MTAKAKKTQRRRARSRPGRIGGLRASVENEHRFYFYSHEPNEPRHIHVDRDDLSAKFWLEPVQLQATLDFARMNCARYNHL